MKPEWRRFASFGLILALVAALGTGGLYFVQREWNLYVQIGLALVVFGLALFAFLDPDRVRQSLTGRQVRYGSNALVMSIAFLGLLVVFNYLVYGNAKRWDLTEDKQFTLAPETIHALNALKEMDEPVHAKAFFSRQVNSEETEKLLDQFKFYSGGKFTYEFLDPELDLTQAMEAGITGDSKIILYQGGERYLVSSPSERDLTSGLVRLFSPSERKVYFLSGHGELSPESSGERRIDNVVLDLDGKGYTVETWNLIANNIIPNDARVIIIAAPQQPMLSAEVALLQSYLEAGGSVIYLSEPDFITQSEQPNAEFDAYLEAAWGIQLQQDMIIDRSSNMPFEYAVGMDFGFHPITSLLEGSAIILPTARSVNVVQAPSGISQVTLVSTSDQSWSETDLDGLRATGSEIRLEEEAGDRRGPIPLAVAAESFISGGRVVVVGDGDFIINELQDFLSNGDFFINSVDWAAGEEEIINITPRQSTQRMLVPPQAWVLNLIALGSVFILPGLVVLSGIVVWVQRRRQG